MSAEALESILALAVPAMISAAILWLVLWFWTYQRRRALNLTVAENVRRDDARPGFLTVDRDARQAKMEGGAAFDAQVAARDAPPEAAPVADRCRGLAKVVTVLLALVTLLTGVVGALMRVEMYDEAVRRLGVWDNVVAIVTQYPLGFAIAVGIVGVTAFNALRMVRNA